jgi:hypothetical protein
MSEHAQEEKTYPVGQSAAFAGSTFVTMGLVDLLAHLGPTGLLVGGLASYVAWKHGPEVYEHLRELLPLPAPSQEEQGLSEASEQSARTHGRSLMDRALRRFPEPVLTFSHKFLFQLELSGEMDPFDQGLNLHPA